MSLKAQLSEDFKAAMKAHDTIRKNTVQMVKARVLQVEKDNHIELDDQGVIEVIAKEVKQRRDSLPEYEKSGREDLVEGLNQEIAVLTEYLPAPLSEEELDAIVKETIEELGLSGMQSMGQAMGAVLPKVKGKADGKAVNELVRKYLA